MTRPTKAIIIGSGIAGIAASIRLRMQGMQVVVYEKNNFPGGKLSECNMGGFQFDAGPSLFTKPELVEDLFLLADEPMEAYFSYEKLPVSCTYFYENGPVVKAYADPQLFAKELAEKLGEEESLTNYLKKSRLVYEKIGTVFLNFSLHKISSFFRANIVSALKAFRWRYLFKTMHQLNQASFSNPLTVQLFDRYATYNGSNPYQAPGMLSLIPHIEHNEGAFYPRGGMISITNALHRLAIKKGVQFEFEAPVERIIQTEGHAKGVVVNGTNIPADIVVSNMDVYFTYHQLLQDSSKAKKLLKQERSSSALIFYWGMKTEFPELGLHNIFFTKNYEAEFDHIFRSKKITDDPTIYVNITCKCEPGLQAPRGRENWFVMVNTAANYGQDWQAYREKYRKSILSKLTEILQKDIASFIETEHVLDPVLIEAGTASFMGSIYGTSANSKTAAFVRHPNFSKKIKGLYFVGGTVHPGGGIPLCLQSAKIMSELVAADLKKMHA